MIGVTGYDHVGIRVSDRGRALAFYAALGFEPAGHADPRADRAVDLINPQGVRINLICNGVTPPDGRNVLMDVADKWPGVTHPAFIVPSLQAVLDWAADTGVAITEGPVEWEGRRRVCFLRDPDGNVLEFDELIGG